LVIDSGRTLIAQHRYAGRKEIARMVNLVSQRMPLTSTHSTLERVQHALCPDDAVGPLLDGWGLFGGGSPEGHCRQWLVRSFGLHAFISLRPFAPPALPGFNATMDALTPAHRPYLEFAAAASYLPWRPLLRPGQDGWGVVARHHFYLKAERLVVDRDPCVLCCTFRPFRLQPPLAVPMQFLEFLSSGLPSSHRLAMRRVLSDRASWASPLSSRLATATGRIEFAVAEHFQPLLRTGRSPPVAPHPASWRRSYLRLRKAKPPSDGDLHPADS
jgi:hypothetical protein